MLKKILGIFGILVLLLVVAVMLLIKIYVTPQRVQRLVQGQLEKSLQRQVLVGEVEVGWLTGIRLDGLHIADRPGENALLAAERIELSYDYLALLHGELLIGQILILQPQLRLVRDVEGRWNIDDLLAGSSDVPPVDRSAEKSPEKSEGAFTLQLVVRKFQVEGGSLQLLDYFEKKEHPAIYKIENLNVRLNDFSLHQSFVTEIEARLNGARLAAEIGYHLDKGFESAELQIEQLDVLPFLPSDQRWLQQGQLDGTLNYRDETLQTRGLQLILNGQRLDIDLDGTRVLSSTARWDVRLRSEYLDMDKLLPAPEASTGGSDSVNSTPAEKGDQIRLPVALPLDLKLQLAIQQLIYQGIAAENLTGQVRVLDNRMQLDKLQMRLAEGQVQLDGEVQLHTRGWPYAGQFKAQQVALGPLADAMLPKGKGSINGRIDLAGPFRGFAGVPDAVAALQTEIEFDLRNGQIQGSPLLAEIAVFLANPELEILGFSRFYGQIGLDKGQGRLDARLESRRAVFVPQGVFSLSGPLDLKLETRLAPEMFKRVGLAGKDLKYLHDDQGWTLLPLRVKGSYARPRITLDEEGAKRQLGQQLGQELERQIDKRLKDKNPEQRRQLDDLLQNSIKQLLK
jgi:AsmA protein